MPDRTPHGPGQQPPYTQNPSSAPAGAPRPQATWQPAQQPNAGQAGQPATQPVTGAPATQPNAGQMPWQPMAGQPGYAAGPSAAQPMPGQPMQQPMGAPGTCNALSVVPWQETVQSASATTDHAGNRSGAFAYVVVVVVLGVLVALSVSLGSLLGSAVSALDYNYGLGDGYGYGYGYEYDYDDVPDPFDLFDDYGLPWDWETDLSDEAASGAGGASDSRTLDSAQGTEALLAVVSESLNEQVAATDYAGSSAAVRSAVKSLCTLDASACAEVSSSLQAALGALDAGDQQLFVQEVHAAQQRARQALDEARTIELPDASEDTTAAITEAQDLLEQRWSQTADALETLEKADGSVPARFSRDAEQAADDLLWQGADDLLDALSFSAAG